MSFEKKHGVFGLCIPTYNRCEILKMNLENLIEKISGYNIKIYISDNHSSDETEQMVAEMRENKYSGIVYSKNEQNLGPDINVEIAAKMAVENYIWIMGDDDTIRGDIAALIELLEKNIYEAVIFGKNRRADPVYTDKESLIIDLAGYMTWISAIIVRRDILLKMDFKKYCGSGLNHTAALLEALCKADFCVFNYDFSNGNRLIDSMRKYYSGFANEEFEIFTENWMNMICSLPYEYRYEAKLQAIANLPTTPFRSVTLLLHRSWGTFNYNMLKKKSRILRSVSIAKYIRMCVVALIPIPIARVIVGVLKYLRLKIWGF